MMQSQSSIPLYRPISAYIAAKEEIHTDIVKQDLISSQCNFDEDRRMSGQIALSTLDLREHIMSLHASHGPFDD